MEAQVGSKHQVVIPKPVREALGLKPRDKLLFLIDGDTVCLRPKPANFTETLLGLHSELWPDADAWLEQERASWQ